MPHKFVEGITTADVAFEADGKTLNELFESCAKATFEVMVKLENVKPKTAKEIEIEEESAEKLLYSFLEELIYLKDVEAMVFSKFDMNVTETSLFCTAWGESIDSKKQAMGSDVKAVTLHKFKVWKEGTKWKARVVLDI